MNNLCTHREYYEQFVSDEIKSTVRQIVGIDALRKSTDEHLNDISLRDWDAISLEHKAELSNKFIQAGDFYSLAGGVCVAKAAARLILAEVQS